MLGSVHTDDSRGRCDMSETHVHTVPDILLLFSYYSLFEKLKMVANFLMKCDAAQRVTE